MTRDFSPSVNVADCKPKTWKSENHEIRKCSRIEKMLYVK